MYIYIWCICGSQHYPTQAPKVHGNTDPGVQISAGLRIQNEKIQTSKNPRIQKSNNSKNPKIQENLQDSVDVKSFGFLGFWVLQLCFQSVETDPNLDSEKAACVSVFTVFLRGVRVVGGGCHIYIYIYVYKYPCSPRSRAFEVLVCWSSITALLLCRWHFAGNSATYTAADSRPNRQPATSYLETLMSSLFDCVMCFWLRFITYSPRKNYLGVSR